MRFHRMLCATVCVAWATAGCNDQPLEPQAEAGGGPAVHFRDVSASTTWNERANVLQSGPSALATAQAIRMYAYMSLAQYRAVIAAESSRERSMHPSVGAAAAAASATVLKVFYPSLQGQIEAWLAADLAAEPWPGAAHQDRAAGEATGRAVGAAVLAMAAADEFNVHSPGTPPTGPGHWVPGATPVARQLYRTRPIVMTSQSQLRPEAPPAFGSPAFLASLAEVRALSQARTSEQIDFVRYWHGTTTPFGHVIFNRVALDLISRHRRKEREAARILAVSNVAVFDAMVACFDAKFAYWYIRPSQADPSITLVSGVGLPNHPAYPSAHSCITGGFMYALAESFPSHRAELEAMIDNAGFSRILAGIHFDFDIAAGQAIGREAAALAAAARLH